MTAHFRPLIPYVRFCLLLTFSLFPLTNSFSEVVSAATDATTTRVSVASDGSQGNATSFGDSALSADGRYIAFYSFASNLVSDDTNATADVFVRDRVTGITTRVSVATGGAQVDRLSGNSIDISADGRYVAFISFATNIVPNDTNGVGDIFVHNRATGETTRVSVASDGTQGDAPSQLHLAISADGRYVAFESLAANLVPNDTNGVGDIFVHDRATGETTRVSVASDGTQQDNNSVLLPFVAISSDGRYIAFSSRATNLVSVDTNGHHDVFVRDRDTGITTRVSLASDSTQGNYDSYSPAISADGRYVAFVSTATNLAPPNLGILQSIFMHDRITGETTRVSVASDGTPAAGHSLAVSADGRYVAFGSTSTLVPEDTNSEGDVYVRDLQTGVVNLASMSFTGEVGNGETGNPNISGNGLHISFYSYATNLVSDDTNGTYDIFVNDRQTGQTTIDYFALGDSIASGHGLMDDNATCRRSNRSYPHTVIELLVTRYETVNSTILACSGATAREPDATTLALDPNKWLQNQVDYVLTHLSVHPTLVSITIGSNDFGWADPGGFLTHLFIQDNDKFVKWVDKLVDNPDNGIKVSVKTQVNRLLAHPNVAVVLTEVHNPFNRASLLFSPACTATRDCYARTEYAVHRLNSALIDLTLETGQLERLQVAAIHESFHSHESPRPVCGLAAPQIANTWIQHPGDSNSNSFGNLPGWARKILPKKGGGDCFHPNDAGASAYADAVNQDVQRVGR